MKHQCYLLIFSFASQGEQVTLHDSINCSSSKDHPFGGLMPYIVPLVPDIAVRPQINHRDSDSDNFENSSWNKHKVLENEEETLEKLDPSQRKHIETQTDFYTTGLLPYAVPLVLDIVVPGMKELIL